MRLSVDLCAGGVAAAAAEMRLRFVLSRFAPSVVKVVLRAVACGPGRMSLHGEARLVGDVVVSLTAEDEVSEAAVVHFIDRLGRAVARRWAGPGGPRA